MENMAEEAETAAEKGDMATVYKTYSENGEGSGGMGVSQ